MLTKDLYPINYKNIRRLMNIWNLQNKPRWTKLLNIRRCMIKKKEKAWLWVPIQKKQWGIDDAIPLLLFLGTSHLLIRISFPSWIFYCLYQEDHHPRGLNISDLKPDTESVNPQLLILACNITSPDEYYMPIKSCFKSRRKQEGSKKHVVECTRKASSERGLLLIVWLSASPIGFSKTSW